MSDPSFGVGLPIAFDTLQALGGLGNIALVLTVAWSKDVKRHHTWLNLCCAWIISSLSYLLLAFGGKQYGSLPSFEHCFISAVLSYGAPIITAFATLSVVIQLWFAVSHITARTKTERTAPFRDYCLVAMPYFFWLLVIIISVAMGLGSQDRIRRAKSGLYCIIDNGILGKVNTGLCVAAAIVTLGLEVSIGIKARKHTSLSGSAKLPVGMLIRVIMFTIAGIVAVAMSFIFITRVFSPLPNIFIAIMPIVAFLIFGTQRDIVNVWLFRHPMGERPSSPDNDYPNKV